MLIYFFTLPLQVLLHGMVMVFEGAVQDGIVALCEMWWKKQLDEREHVIINILPIVLDATSTKNARVRIPVLEGLKCAWLNLLTRYL